MENEKIKSRLILYARRLINQISLPTDLEIHRFMKENEEDFEGFTFDEFKEVVDRLVEIEQKRDMSSGLSKEEVTVRIGFEKNYELENDKELINIDELVKNKEDENKFKFITSKSLEEKPEGFNDEEETVGDNLMDKLKEGLNKGFQIAKKIGQTIYKVLYFIFDKYRSIETDMVKITLTYKRKIQRELDYAESIINKRSSTTNEVEKAEKRKNKLTNRNQYSDLVAPELPLLSKLSVANKLMFYDEKIFVVYWIVNGFLIWYVLNTGDYLYEILIYNFIVLSVYMIHISRKIVEFIEENYLSDFMWKKFPKSVGMRSEYYELVTNIQRDNARGELPDLDGIDLSELRDLDVSDIDFSEFETPERKYNPLVEKWEEVFSRFYKNHSFKEPEIVTLETTEIHIFDIPSMSISDFLGKQEQIENFLKKRIYKIYREYEGKIGNIGVELENAALPKIVSYSEVPKSESTKIYLGKGVKEWVSWNLDVDPHCFVAGGTGTGKSRTMAHLINEIIQKDWLPIFVDFKNKQEFGIYEKKGYRVIGTKEEFALFTQEIIGEYNFRSSLSAKYLSHKLDSLNYNLKEEGIKELPRILIIIDEYATVNEDKDDYSNIINPNMSAILSKSRSVGINCIIATQSADANTFGGGNPRRNIGCRLIGKQQDDSGYKMGFGVENLSATERKYINRLPNTEEKRGMFIAKGGGEIEDYVIVRTPFMKENEFNKMVLEKWKDNIHKDYQLNRGSVVNSPPVVADKKEEEEEWEEFDDYPTMDDNGNNLDEVEVPKLPSSKYEETDPFKSPFEEDKLQRKIDDLFD